MGAAASVDHLPQLSLEEKEAVLDNVCTLRKLAEYIKEGKAKKICFCTGAGISVSAGIPDFRTKGTGLYDNLQKYDLPTPESIFDYSYFCDDPTPFYDLSRDLLPSNFKPTPVHYFIKLMENKGLLLRCYTQNIDTLEQQAGVSAERVIEAHGSFATATCTKCNAKYSQEYYRDRVVNCTDGVTNANGEKIPWCRCISEITEEESGEVKQCKGNIKPDIVFFWREFAQSLF